MEQKTQKKSNSQAVSDFRRNRKVNLILACGEKCCICGYNKAISALEFHHIDPLIKEYAIAAKGTCHNIQKDISEIRKCVLVCANCHREIHEGLYTSEELYNYQYFNEEIIEKLLHPSKQQQRYCSECSALISNESKSGLCQVCSKKATRIVERPDRETLKQLIQQYPFTQLGSMYGVTDNAVRKWCKAYGLPSKKSEIILVQDWSEI